MKCPKCGFNSFESHDKCKKCGKDLSTFKTSFNIRPVVLQQRKEAPGDLLVAEIPRDMATPPAPAAAPAAPAEPVLYAAAAPALGADEFSFDDGAIDPPAAMEEKRVAPPPHPPEPPKDDFSLNDFIHFADLNGGKGGGESTHSFGKGGFDLEDLFPPDPPRGGEEPEESAPPPEQKDPEKKEEHPPKLDWLE